MPLPIIADTYQMTLVWGNPNMPRPATNVLHFFDQSGVSNEAGLFADFYASVTAAMWGVVSTPSVIGSANITKLDGVSAGQVFAVTAAAKVTGNGGTDAIPQGSCVVSLKSAQRGARGRNRIFLPWPGETSVLQGLFSSGDVTAMATAWSVFANTMQVADWQLVAVSGTYSNQNPVTSIAVRSALKTQRRRARR